MNIYRFPISFLSKIQASAEQPGKKNDVTFDLLKVDAVLNVFEMIF